MRVFVIHPLGNKEGIDFELVDRMQALRSTLASAERDSPVFKSLPRLGRQGRGQLITAPYDFQEEVERARRDNRRGDLRLFAHEVKSLEWGEEGLRLIGDAQFGANDDVPARVILFTGHMVDAPNRPEEKMRFPRTARAEAIARTMILDALKKEVPTHESGALGIAGGACGSDILFHEVCRELGVQTELYLALPKDKFEATSVRQGGAHWVERYRRLLANRVPKVLQETEALPRWLADKPAYDLWERNNFWMLFNAIATGSRHLTLIALFNREREPDGPGGTKHLVEEARHCGFKTIELDARKLLA